MLFRVQELRERLASKMKRLGFDDTFSPNDPGSNGGPSTQTPPLPNSISSNSISSTTASTKAGTNYQCDIRASNLDPTVIAGNIFLAPLREKQSKDIDLDISDVCNEVPLLEASLGCDNLLCDALGRAPSCRLVLWVRNEPRTSSPDPGGCPAEADSISTHTLSSCTTGLETMWRKYCQTEIVEKSSNPCYMRTTGTIGDRSIFE